MKKNFISVIFVVLSILMIVIFASCQETVDASKTTSDKHTPEEQLQHETVKANSFFWGTWVRMDNGQEYYVLESSVMTMDGDSFDVTATDGSTLGVTDLGTFRKESDSVMVCNNIPYFRKGGANLEYTLKIVGFASSTSRAAGIEMSGIKGKGKSSRYKDFESSAVSDSEGNIKLTAPTANDPQTVTITNGDDVIVIPGLNIENSGDYMGTVALVGKKDYNLKITGTISNYQKDDGYLYGNNAKIYEMIVTITNISENKCSTSGCSIESADSNLKLNSETNLKGFTISTLAAGATKTIKLSLSYGTMTDPYVDTGIVITIKNPFTGQEWKDYIPLRFFKGTIPITISAKNPENNSNAALNGFIIYPDGNNQFFAIKNNSCKAVFVPTFGKDKTYMLVFSGATVTSQLDDSTEMYYTVEPASLSPKKVVTEGALDEILKYIGFGGDNHSEDNAYSVTEGFESYLREGEIDYYNILAESDDYYSPEKRTLFCVSYENEKGECPNSFLTANGTTLSSIQLPEIKNEGYYFLGWYSENQQVIPDNYIVRDNVTLTAKYQLKNYYITYNLNGGKNNESNSSYYTIESSPMVLKTPIRTGYNFEGWFNNEEFKGNDVKTIGGGITGDMILYAKWTPIKYKITYELNAGINNINNPAIYTIENNAIILSEPSRKGFVFGGWYKTNSYDGNKQTVIDKGSYGDRCYYAKWLKECTINYESEYGTIPETIIVGEDEMLSSEHLPELICSDFYFGGLYDGEEYIQAENYIIKGDVTLTAHWIDKCMISYVSKHGTTPNVLFVESGTSLNDSQLPKLTASNCIFKGWYVNNSFIDENEVKRGYVINNSLTLYAKWDEYITFLPEGTNGTAGTNATYVLFGEWPQTIKADNIIIDESIKEEHGMFTYYSGSDGEWYVKCLENGSDSYNYTYSNGTSVGKGNNGSKYFKIEPIKWRVLTKNYNNTGNALLFAENILTANVSYYDNSYKRTINGNTVYANNYKESKIRAYLNGISYLTQLSYDSDLLNDNSYSNNGFLQTAFTLEVQKIIATTTVDNSVLSTTDSENNVTKATIYACQNTNDKIFLLSEMEVTTTDYKFDKYDSSGPDNTRIRVATDFAKANNSEGNEWWLRSPIYHADEYRSTGHSSIYPSDCSLIITGSGAANVTFYSGLSLGWDTYMHYIDDVESTCVGIVPALTISLE